MTHRRLRTAAAALALAIGTSAGSAANAQEVLRVAQAEVTDINAAIIAYGEAQATYEAAQSTEGADVEAARAELDAAEAELGSMCEMLGYADIETCIADVTAGSAASAEGNAAVEAPAPAELAPVEAPAVEEPTIDAPSVDAPAAPDQPVVEDPAAPEPVSEDPAVAEPEAPAPAEAPVPAEAETDEQAAPAQTVDDAPAPADPETAPAEAEAAPEPTPAEQQPAEAVEPEERAVEPAPEQPTTAAPVAEQTAPEEPAAVEPAAEAPAEEPAPEVNPAGTPIPRDLSLAIATYEDANRKLANTTSGTPEAESAAADVETARTGVQTLCEGAGTPDLAACLAAYGVALTPVATPMAAGAAEAEAAPSETATPENEAPLLDSAKDAERDGAASAPADQGAEAPQDAERAPAPPPQNDEEAQSEFAPEAITSIEAEQGTKTDATAAMPQAAPPADAEVVEQEGPRIVIRFGNQTYVNNQSDTRLDYGASERYVEDLSRGRTRETIVRPDGTRLVTIYNRYGEILRRSYFDRNGEEAVLSYVPEDRAENDGVWRDPGEELPPLQLGIPAEDYVLDAQRADLDTLTRFLDAPPVERVQRLYSINEVKRSARVRDMVRRLEVGNLTFDFGKSVIPPDQIGSLSIVANAMLKLIDDNPAETFLIEGHTDAVGSDNANLILSDERAYSVAITLTEVYGVPPENIVTQGYGERYLKVMTPEAERANRRVTFRRITPLVAPVNSGVAAGS